jgi:TRAP-type C4-dicarboxylate transport system substrate-binding protein
MKKISKILASTVMASSLILLSACGGGASNTSGAEKISLKASSGLSTEHGWFAFFNPWMEEVSETNKVNFDVFSSGELVPASKEYDALRSGTIDVAIPFLPIYDPGRFPLTEVTMLPILESDTKIASIAFANMMQSDREVADGKTYYELEYSDNDLVAFPISTTQEYAISTTGFDFKNVSDFKKVRLRTPSRVHEILAKKLGVNTVTMPAAEMFDALSRGAFEGSFYSIADWTGYGFQDLFKYTLEGLNFGHFSAAIAMTTKTWEKLPKEVQDSMTKSAEANLVPSAEEWMKRAEENIKNNKEQGGKFVNVNDLDPSIKEYAEKAMVETWQEWIEELEKEGKPGKAMAILWRDMLIEAGGKVPAAIEELE